MRSADAPVRSYSSRTTESFAEVHVVRMKDCARSSKQKDSGGSEGDSPSSANRRWQSAWRRKHPITCKNQSWLYRTTRKIHGQLMDGLMDVLDGFPDLPEQLYQTVMEDLKDAFRSELGSHTDCRPQLIRKIEHVLSLSRTQKLLHSLDIPCNVFYSALEARTYQEQVDLHDVWAQLPPGRGRGPMHLLVRIQGRRLNEHEVFSWSQPPRGGGWAPPMRLFIRRCVDPYGQSSRMKREPPGGTEVNSPLPRQRRKIVNQLTLCPVGSPMQPRVFNALQKMLRARRSF